VIKRNPTPGSPAYEELERKRVAKKKQDGKDVNPTDTQSDQDQTPEAQGQRQQPKKKKKKKQ
jgi:YidC/Oxa1 family membrane protein insertase